MGPGTRADHAQRVRVARTDDDASDGDSMAEEDDDKGRRQEESSSHDTNLRQEQRGRCPEEPRAGAGTRHKAPWHSASRGPTAEGVEHPAGKLEPKWPRMTTTTTTTTFVWD